MSDGICLRLGRADMNTFSTIDKPGRRRVVHVAGRHGAALCPRCERPSVRTNGTRWREVIDVVRTLVITVSICLRRFVCEADDCTQKTFDERFEGIDRGGASARALGWFAERARGRATRAVARDLAVPEHYLRLAVGTKRSAAHQRQRGRLGRHLAIDECSVRKNFIYATVFSDPDRAWSSTWRRAATRRRCCSSPRCSATPSGPGSPLSPSTATPRTAWRPGCCSPTRWWWPTPSTSTAAYCPR